jgi:DNA-binding HxlR family transcriptional regulator
MMRRASFAHMDCSVAQALEVVGEWWTLLIIREFFAPRHKHRFEEIQEDLGIARNILTARLQSLLEHGVIERRLYQEHPPRYEYHLTRKGRDLLPVILSLLAWGDRWAEHETGPPVQLRHTTCDHRFSPVLTCSHCGEQVQARTVEASYRRSPAS